MIRTLIIGYHNPLFHGYYVTKAWLKIFKEFPTIKELICILLHDIGYINQSELDGKNNTHPELGAKICGKLFGEEYYNLCIAHSRDYANEIGISLSKLGYADKYAPLLIPDKLYITSLYLGGEAQEYHRTTKSKRWGIPIQISKVKATYQEWWDEHGLIGVL